jgi:glycosyltransferase involved in cell wall biosynthesis
MGQEPPPEGQPLVSVVIAVRDAEATIRMALQSIMSQTYRTLEIIVIDDGSRDSSVEIIQQLNDARIHLFSDGKRMGLPSRLNQAVGLARGEFIARMDADDVSYSQRIERQVDFLLSHPEVDLVGAGAVVFHGDGIASGKRLPPQLHEDITARPFEHIYMVHPTFLGRSDWFRNHPYNQVALRAQDQILLLATYTTSRFANLNELLIGYREEGVSLAKSARGRFAFIRAVVRMNGWLAPQVVNAVILHCAKLCIEWVAVFTRTERYLLSHRAQQLHETEAFAWNRVWRSQSVGESHQSAGRIESQPARSCDSEMTDGHYPKSQNDGQIHGIV